MRPWTLIVITLMIIWMISAVQCQQDNEGVIFNGPQTQVAAPGDTVVFNCHARGYSYNVYWYINGSDPHPHSFYEEKGFTFNSTELPRPNEHLREFNNTITVEARPSNNNTRISCVAEGKIYGQRAFQEGTLIIAGPPMRPTIISFSQEHVANSSNFTYQLNWSAPFTWPGFPILSYNVIVLNHLDNESISTIMPINGSNSTTLSLDGITYGEICYGLTFYITASNHIGDGEHAIIQSGHHIVPGEIKDIETTVTFLSNGTPHLWMSFSAPRICPGYQTGSYSIVIFDDSGSPTHAFEPLQYTQEREDVTTLVVNEMKTGFNFSKHYVIEVTATSMGIKRLKRKEFNTFLDEHLVYKPDDCSQRALTVGITVGGIAILTFGCLCMCLLLCICIACRRMRSSQKLSRMPAVIETDSVLTVKEKKTKSTKPPNLVLQAKNPIYEGAMYETTPGESLKSLLSPFSVPCTPLADAATRYTFDFPPKLPPPRKGSVSITPKLETHEEIKDSFKQANLPSPHLIGDEYMIMNVGNSNKGVTVSESHGTSKDLTYTTVGNEDEYVSFK